MDGTRTLSQLSFSLGFARHRIDRAISDGCFRAIDAKTGDALSVEKGKARSFRFLDAIRLACYVQLLDAGLPVKVGNAIGRLHAFKDQDAYLVVEAHVRNLQCRDVHSYKLEDVGHPYIAHVCKADEILESFERSGEPPNALVVINVNQVEQRVLRAWRETSDEPSGLGN